MTTQMPNWPVWRDNPDQHDWEDEIDYALALAAAWEARCRLAVEALDKIRGTYRPTTLQAVNTLELAFMDEAHQAIAAIGPLPTLREGE